MGAPRGPRHRSRAGAKLFSRVFARKQKSVFRIREGRLAPKSRPSAIRGAPNSRLVSAPRAPFGTPKNVQRVGIIFCKKLPPTTGTDLRAKHQKSSKIITFRICGRDTAPPGPQNGPKTRPKTRPCLSVLRKWAPRGAPVIAAERARNFFSHFSRAKKTSLFAFAVQGRPKNAARARSEAPRIPE